MKKPKKQKSGASRYRNERELKQVRFAMLNVTAAIEHMLDTGRNSGMLATEWIAADRCMRRLTAI